MQGINIRKMEKKKYLYGLTYGLWDLLTENSWENDSTATGNKSVMVYNINTEKFVKLGALDKKEYSTIIESTTITHEMFINSPEIAIELLKKENEKKI